MWTFSNYSGMATTVVDFTNEFTPLFVGLVGLVALSAGMITFMALRYHWAQRSRVNTRPVSIIGEHPKAA
jgi:hypothetical protein